jgi:hypothetical protein
MTMRTMEHMCGFNNLKLTFFQQVLLIIVVKLNFLQNCGAQNAKHTVSCWGKSNIANTRNRRNGSGWKQRLLRKSSNAQIHQEGLSVVEEEDSFFCFGQRSNRELSISQASAFQ